MHKKNKKSRTEVRRMLASKANQNEKAKKTFKVGNRVRVIGEPHMAEHKDAEGEVKIVEDGAYGILFDGMDEVHKWYSGSELELVEKMKAAQEESLDQKVNKIRKAFYDQNKSPAMPRMEMWIREVYEDHVIVDAGDDGMFKVTFTLDGEGQTKFAPRSEWEKVKLTYVADFAKHALQFARKDADGQKKGTTWEVTIIETGITKTNPPFYVTQEALEASLSVFEGAKLYSVMEGDANGHKKDPSKKVTREIVGVFTSPFIDGNKIKATVNILPSEEWLRENLLFLEEKNQLHVYQLSIDSLVDAEKKYVEAAGKEMLELQKILKADVDIVGEAAAGGRFNRLVASQPKPSSTGAAMIKQKLMVLFTLFYPAYLSEKSVDWLKVNENDLYTHLLAADKAQPRLHLPDGMDEKLLDDRIQKYQAAAVRGAEQPPNSPAQPAQPVQAAVPAGIDQNALKTAVDQVLTPMNEQLRALQLSNCSNLLAAKLLESKLPQVLKDKIAKRWKDKVFTSAELDQDIKDVREMFAAFAQPRIDNMGMDIHMGADQSEKLHTAIDAMFATSQYAIKQVKKGTDEYKTLFGDIDPMRSIKEAYIMLTGDVNVTGERPRGQRLLASLESSDWANVISTAINKRMARDYPQLGLDTWRNIVDTREGVKDFKEQQTVRYGGYPNLPIVGERGTYQPLSSPTDEKAVWTPAKRGGTEDLSLEMIKNDDVSAVQKIPTRLVRAAAQTLHEFIYDFIRPGVNPTIYDGLALYHATHANTGTTALGTDGVALGAARLRMKKQTQLDNGKRLGLRAGFLIVPSDLEKLAHDLLTPAFNKSNQVPEFLQSIGITPIVVDYWDDATDWVLAAKREDLVGLEIGFVDGMETPQVFVSDLPNVGSFFTNDVITYKIRHAYGGAIQDFRAFDGEIVAG